MNKKLYPGLDAAEREREINTICDEEPDFIADSPNYDKFAGFSPEQVLVWLNVD